MSMGGNDTYKKKLVKYSKLKRNAKNHRKKKPKAKRERHNLKKKCKRGK